jgi:hypothetical protein
MTVFPLVVLLKYLKSSGICQGICRPFPSSLFLPMAQIKDIVMGSAYFQDFKNVVTHIKHNNLKWIRSCLFMVNTTQTKRQTFGMVLGLVLLYLLGIYTNLYVHFPENETKPGLMRFAVAQIPLVLHIILGLMVLIGSIVIFIRAIFAKNTRLTLLSGISLIAILGGVMGGFAFITEQSEGYSFLMASGFIVSVFSYFLVLFDIGSK